MSEKNRSKSQRVRDYLSENPSVRNKDVVKALAQYGVTAADVSNAKAHLNKKESKRRARPPASELAKPNVDGSMVGEVNGQIAYSELQAALSFVKQIGSIDRARQLLVIIQQIQRLPSQ